MKVEKIKYRDGYKYQLASGYSIQVSVFPTKHIATEYIVLSMTGVLIINEGYAWDGPSGPTIDSKNFMRGSLVHDALYQLMRGGLISERWREQADKELQRICIEDGMWKIRAWWVYRAVRDFGGSSAARCKTQILEAP
ncbi:hypothetical protein [Geobacter sp. SVR]|uniref:hypothetical protein n=1 Tax=Geobacter sp. SVR TaxID=2495594 RepID=UPI00143EF91A|nr:hypothetical protein [Geobacter sp. SVR]BCS54792.1 hypothetical protein GSVR_31000 [Geobacter sp. SVR]GCF86400.1 hypothetical protein GSbR_30000 [Geobacter sp. SVR]